jgi:aminopeptidase-like protein
MDWSHTPLLDLQTPAFCQQLGERAFDMVRELYPVCRSITGAGVRESLAMVARRIPLTIFEVPSGTQVFDWQVPPEWNIRDAYVADSSGRRVIDFQSSNLHVVSYSVPIKQRMSLAELRPHLHSLPQAPDRIPYRTSYYHRDWGFCLRHSDLQALADGEYQVHIDSNLSDGSLTYAECVLPGELASEVIVFTHVCHPSLANDNATGIAVATELAAALGAGPRRYTYRFVFAPGTIGAITWLARNEPAVSRIVHGLVVGLLGDSGPLTYKRSARGDAQIDCAAAHVLRTSGRPFSLEEFSPYGYDERQFCSPGFDLPVGRLTRSPNGAYPEYHTSADDLSIVSSTSMAESLATLARIVEVLETDRVCLNTAGKCEPMLGRRGLYRAVGGEAPKAREHALLWVLNQSNGRRSLLEVAERAGLPYGVIRSAAQELAAVGLLTEYSGNPERS